MLSLRQIGLCLCTSASLFLVGCQHTSMPKSDTNTPLITANNHFQLSGKIGVRTPQQSGSAFFTWLQQEEQFELELTGILGVGKTQIYGQPGHVSLNSAKTGLIEAESAEELLQRATGWQAPISYLVDWVQARPAHPSTPFEKDSQGRIIHMMEDDWDVTLSYQDQAALPNLLILKQLLENGQENRITMLIQNR